MVRGLSASSFLPPACYPLVILAAALVLFVDYCVNARQARLDLRRQKRRLIDFETKLGLNSPL